MFFVIFFWPRGIPYALYSSFITLKLYSQYDFSHRFNPQLIFITLGRGIASETCTIIYAKVNSKDIRVYKQYSSPRRCINCRIQINFSGRFYWYVPSGGWFYYFCNREQQVYNLNTFTAQYGCYTFRDINIMYSCALKYTGVDISVYYIPSYSSRWKQILIY